MLTQADLQNLTALIRALIKEEIKELRQEMLHIKEEMLQMKVEILSEMQNLRDDHMINISYRDDIEDHEKRIRVFETRNI